MTDASKVIGRRIKAARLAKSWTQHDLAERVGVKELTVSRWERGENPPRVEMLYTLSGLLGVTIEALLADEGVAA